MHTDDRRSSLVLCLDSKRKIKNVLIETFNKLFLQDEQEKLLMKEEELKNTQEEHPNTHHHHSKGGEHHEKHKKRHHHHKKHESHSGEEGHEEPSNVQNVLGSSASVRVIEVQVE